MMTLRMRGTKCVNWLKERLMKAGNLQRIIFLGILLLFADQAWTEDWTYYDTTLAGTMYYDKSSIFEAKKGILSVWTKNIMSTDSKTQYFSILKKIEKAPDDPSKLSYYKNLMEIDLPNKKFRYVHAVFYDDQGNIIHASSENEASAWNTIEADSVGEKLMKLVSAEFAVTKETDVAEKVEKPIPPEETIAVAKNVEPALQKETGPVAKATEPVSTKDTAAAAHDAEPVYPKETVHPARAESVPPKEPVITAKVEKPVAPKETVSIAKATEPAPAKDSAEAAHVGKTVYPKQTLLAAKIAESIPLKETAVAAKVEKPVPAKETVVTAVTVPEKKPIPDKSNQHEAKTIQGDDRRKTGLKSEDPRDSGNMLTDGKSGIREVQDQKSGFAAENRPAVSTAAGEIARDGRFIAFDNQTVLDTKTNLMWAAKDNGRDINWYNAKKYCESYRGGGYTDWRMPTQDELAQLYDAGKAQRSDAQQNPLHLTGLIRLTDCCPWSSKTRGSEAAYFDFTDGTHWWFVSPGTSINRAIPVRSAK
jgi:hypothetical protein